jgi:hypothetical protein
MSLGEFVSFLVDQTDGGTSALDLFALVWQHHHHPASTSTTTSNPETIGFSTTSSSRTRSMQLPAAWRMLVMQSKLDNRRP